MKTIMKRPVWKASMILMCTFLFLIGAVKGQESAETKVDPSVVQKSQNDLLELKKVVGIGGSGSSKATLKSLSIDGNPKTIQDKDAALMEILNLKNQVLSVKEMPESRRIMNVESILKNLKSILSDNEYNAMIKDKRLIEQLGLTVDLKSTKL